MTFLSRIYINPRTRGGRLFLTNRQAMHAAVEGCFPPDGIDKSTGRVLWRLDKDRYRQTLYVVSPIKPDMRHIVEQAGWDGQEWDTADYSTFLSKLDNGQKWAFRLVANPVKALSRGEGKRGKIVPHVGVEHQKRWLLERAHKHGFSLNVQDGAGAIPDLAVTERLDHRFAKSRVSGTNRARQRITLRLVQFDGSLTVENADELREVLVQGIGRGRAYGGGLLTLRRIEPNGLS
ncbi:MULTISPECIES: type I-E CRISPR-associated protein Cas6/Cse3/CasE [Auritidibacter]|uniref:type I-E CRISPR-associated protein Cas6/Cse3/CasE n=1 Tax=Auritidibacter TaxID=1160973 RepID=UPI000D738776|nr:MULTISPECIES: type I-E CRISPR-associated protein Cas6/Cse3/CasE [Auritidibacter]AXR74409.1 type I-E CRISPR-associated protein Cas6/Cse3/CasE [Auritidibacter sp. NML130574]WGH83403.1 type I-E CRISPR-associated protein Cas6/Cse3/CasE [Auritidibacter ignavus]WHS29196.1 type I-E CRISPR-associated protein Cas6/Cse3/CasE [Auritidibacter ignavus]